MIRRRAKTSAIKWNPENGFYYYWLEYMRCSPQLAAHTWVNVTGGQAMSPRGRTTKP